MGEVFFQDGDVQGVADFEKCHGGIIAVASDQWRARDRKIAGLGRPAVFDKR